MTENNSNPNPYNLDGNRPRPGVPTAKQIAFIERYLQCWNARQAAKFAGYKNLRSGYENLTKPYIQEIIKARQEELIMSTDEIVMRIGDQARWDPGRYTRVDLETGKATVDVKAVIDDGWGHMIKGIKETAHGQVIEFHDAQRALLHLDNRDKELRVRMSGQVDLRYSWLSELDALSKDELEELDNEFFETEDSE